ncbi:solute:proton antiporter [Aureococcus anophagefferens]|nr:solute:proton antiporter [Aureococcus anophagefferens]
MLAAAPELAAANSDAVVTSIVAPDLTDGDVAMSGFSHDALVFLAATVVVTPLSRVLDVSPILGYLVAGCALGPAGLNTFQDLAVDDELAEIGILFLLFEQGLELTLERLEALKVYAFGLGTAQVLLCSLCFGAFPFLGGVEFLENLVGARPELVAIARPDEALVIGAALSLSSSAFDVAVVPLLVLLPIIEDTQVLGFDADLWSLAASALSSTGALLGALLGGRVVLRRVFAAVAGARSSETFVALCLLVVLGTGALTDALGLSSTLGAFVAGVLLAETNYRDRIEADIQPFRGLLLGLFFVTTGAAVDVAQVAQELPTARGAPRRAPLDQDARGLRLRDARRGPRPPRRRAGRAAPRGRRRVRVRRFNARRAPRRAPPDLARLDTAVVVLSMALTPALGSSATPSRTGGRATTPRTRASRSRPDATTLAAAPDRLPGPRRVVAIRGFGPEGMTVAAVLAEAAADLGVVAFDEHVPTVAEARARGLPVAYGALTPTLVASVLAGDEALDAVLVPAASAAEVERLRKQFPDAPLLASAASYDAETPPLEALAAAEVARHGLSDAGADVVVGCEVEPQLRLAAAFLAVADDRVRRRLRPGRGRARVVAGLVARRDLDIFYSGGDDGAGEASA